MVIMMIIIVIIIIMIIQINARKGNPLENATEHSSAIHWESDNKHVRAYDDRA